MTAALLLGWIYPAVIKPEGLGQGSTQPLAPRDLKVCDVRGICDERSYYLEGMGLMNARYYPSMPHHFTREWGEKIRREKIKVVQLDCVGVTGFYAGPDAYIIDAMALSDPLLARLPALRDDSWGKTAPPEFSLLHWRIGHFRRAIPIGYMETQLTGSNLIEDPDLRAYYDKLLIITRGNILTSERFKEILKMNFGVYDYLIEDYVAHGQEARLS